ncbi:anti-sigma factor family protein [Streptomyces sp. NPDC012794]|uniref:anti-sigma factor family protein n=1 Tax=Streptomyces sp. NPDC012794 TaxID=3364850 RepID=UPI0036CF3BAD
MSPTTGTTGTAGTTWHPEVSEISDLTEGLLPPSRTAEVRSHLGGCALCADVLASLEEIRSLLGTLPGPPRMPSAIAGRIDAALAAEVLLDSKASRTEAATPDPHPADAVSRETVSAAVGRSGRTEAHRPTGHPSGPTGPGRRRARRRIAVLSGLAGAAACALGVFLFTGLGGTGSHDTATRNDTARASAGSSTPGEYTAQGLRQTVRQLLAGEAAGNAPKTAPGEANKSLGLEDTSPGLAPADRLASPQAEPDQTPVPPCVQRGTGRTDAPVAAERGSYQGTPVYLVVLPHPGDPARVDAYLVPAGCADNAAPTPDKPLLTSTYPRN